MRFIVQSAMRSGVFAPVTDLSGARAGVVERVDHVGYIVGSVA